MTRSHKLAGALMTLLSGIAVYCFFAMKYPYHIHFQEQYQLFESTWEYFCGTASVPGGFSDWIGRLLTQFFYYAPAGAAIMALLFCAVQLLTWAVCRRRSLPVFALSFIPAFAMLVFYCDESALAGGAVAVILSLACAALCGLVRRDGTRHVLQAVLVPAVYMACGPLAVVYVLVTVANELSRNGLRAWPVIAATVVLLVVCPPVAARIFNYPLERLCLGVHYYRFHNILPGMLWVSALCCILVAACSCLGAKDRHGRMQLPVGLGVFVLVAALGTGLTLHAAD